jgi:hypothetical protein
VEMNVTTHNGVSVIITLGRHKDKYYVFLFFANNAHKLIINLKILHVAKVL